MKTCSIIIPTYNQQEAWLREALRSAKDQTIPCEIIVVDDGSSPRQEDVVRDVLGDSAVYHWQENKGVAGALNKAIKLSTGQLISWLPSDDVFHPEKMERQRLSMSQGNWLVSYTAWWQIGGDVDGQKYDAPQAPTQEDLFYALKQGCFINCATIMWDRKVFDMVGGFDLDNRHCQDYEMLLRCAERWNFRAVNSYLGGRRYHEHQMSQLLHQEKEQRSKAADLKKLQDRYNITPRGVYIPPKWGMPEA